ncbi:hypothetical protein FNV43_RR00481 [Rhamnella rubrinervis]|uniref:Uncharacterized protein n=1 Tax=Rhamnella rubrinervis TaxID=2594499 RepID=A0A8K0MRZ1_9ROSA|nr:hypothetical protein FNV43_RR00481 [Rhamnella rubrinervis]
MEEGTISNNDSIYGLPYQFSANCSLWLQHISHYVPLDLVKVVTAPIVGHKTYCDAYRPFYDVSVIDVHQAGHVDWLRSSSANETSILKPSKYLFDRRLYLYGEFSTDRSHPVSSSFPRHLPTAGVYNDNFWTLMLDCKTTKN